MGTRDDFIAARRQITQTLGQIFANAAQQHGETVKALVAKLHDELAQIAVDRFGCDAQCISTHMQT